MNKDCVSTRKSLRKYLRGHLFKYEQVRIARHLNACPLCRSEFQALQKVADTKQLLKDITPPEGIGQRMKAGAAGLGKLKLLIYRPLWMLLLLGAATVLYVNLLAPHRDVEIENIEKTLPPSAPLASAPAVTSPQAAASPVPVTASAPQHAAPPDPLVVTVVPRDDGAVAQVNEIMQEHGELKKMKFTETVRRVSGSLSEKELRAFFDRIGQAGKVSYSRKKLASFPDGEAIRFILKMKPAPKIVEQVAPAEPLPAATVTAATTTAPSSDREEKKPDQPVPGQ